MRTSCDTPAQTPFLNFTLKDPAADLRQARATLAQHGYLRIDSCLDDALAECTYSELLKDPRYVQTEDSKAGEYGVLECTEDQPSPGVEECSNFLRGPSLLEWLGRLVGKKLKITRQPSPFRMKQGDCIVAHDDCTDYPSNRLSAVLHFSKAWRRQFGGNLIVGHVKRIETSPPSANGGRRWVFSSNRSVVVPVFNSLVLIALKPGLAHKVTRVRGDNPRLTIVATYGLETAS